LAAALFAGQTALFSGQTALFPDRGFWVKKVQAYKLTVVL